MLAVVCGETQVPVPQSFVLHNSVSQPRVCRIETREHLKSMGHARRLRCHSSPDYRALSVSPLNVQRRMIPTTYPRSS